MTNLHCTTASALPSIIASVKPSEPGSQILTFILGNRNSESSENGQPPHATDYGIELSSVQEIRGYTQATPIPNTPAYIKGAINLRGAVIPVIDLRVRFGVSRPEYTKFTVTIVVRVGGKTVGLVADGVSDVLTLQPSDLMPPPDFGGASSTDCIDSIASIEGRLLLMLNLRKMLAPDGMADPAAILTGED